MDDLVRCFKARNMNFAIFFKRLLQLELTIAIYTFTYTWAL